MTITRAQYIADSREIHHAYFYQFATPVLQRAVVQCIGLDMIQASTDKSFNDIPMERWDRMYPLFVQNVDKEMVLAAGETVTPSLCVNTLKTIARELKEG